MTVGVEDYCLYLRAKGYTEGTIHWQKSHLEDFSDYLTAKEIPDFTQVTAKQIISYLAYLNQPRRLCVRTRQAHLSAIKGLFSYLLKQGVIDSDPAAPVEPPQGPTTLPEILTEEEVLRILAAPDLRTLVGVRDRAILELLYSSGIRRRELVNLNVADVDLEQGWLRVNQGKNKKDRVVPVGETACKFIEAYLKLIRWWFLRNPAENALFLDSLQGKRLSSGTILYIVKKAVKKSKIRKKTSPHIFRHTMATHLLQNQADIRHIQMMLGHASVASTEIYTRLMIDDLKEAILRAHPHGKRPGSGQDSP